MRRLMLLWRGEFMKRGARGLSDNSVTNAIDVVGGPTRAARICGVSNAAIHQWIKRGSVPLLKHALRLSRASGIPIEKFAGDEEE